MTDINLLPQEEKANEKYYKLVHRLQFFSIGVLAVVAVVTVVTLVLFTSFSSKRSSLVLQLEDLSSQVNSYKSQEELIVVVKDKVHAAEELTSVRIDYQNFFSKLAQIVPQGIFFTDFRVSANKAVISGRAKNSGDVASLVSILTSSSGTQLLSDASLDTLSSDETGVFSFVISAKIVGD